MDDEDGYFGERVAAGYDESSAGMFEPGVVDAALSPAAARSAWDGWTQESSTSESRQHVSIWEKPAG